MALVNLDDNHRQLLVGNKPFYDALAFQYFARIEYHLFERDAETNGTPAVSYLDSEFYYKINAKFRSIYEANHLSGKSVANRVVLLISVSQVNDTFQNGDFSRAEDIAALHTAIDTLLKRLAGTSDADLAIEHTTP
jgi:hypothetical protein